MEIYTFNVNYFKENTYFLVSDNEGVIIDPGFQYDYERRSFLKFIKSKNIIIKAILLTHCHIDHIFGMNFIKDTFSSPIYAHKAETFLLKTAKDLTKLLYDIDIDEPYYPDKYIQEGDIISFGNSKLEVIHTPGHTPGGLSFVSYSDKVLFTGDTLFFETIGRTDLPNSSFDDIYNSIHNKLFKLPDDFIVYPGHGKPTTIGHEKRNNPFL